MSSVILCKMRYSWNKIFFFSDLFFVAKYSQKALCKKNSILQLDFARLFSRFCFIMVLSCNNVTAELLHYVSETHSACF